MSETEDLREALLASLSTHTIECTGLGEVTCRGCRDLGWMSWSAYRAHTADAVLALPQVAELRGKVERVEALLDKWQHTPDHYCCERCQLAAALASDPTTHESEEA